MDSTETNSNSVMTFGRVFRFCWNYWIAHKVWFLIVVIGSIGMVAAQLCQPIFAGRLVDAIAQSGDQPAAQDAAVNALIGFIIVLSIYPIMRQIANRIWVRLTAHNMADVLSSGFVRVQRFSTDWHANSFSGATVRKLSRGKWAFDQFADTMYFGFVPTTLILTGVITTLTYNWLVVGAVAAAMMAAYLFVTYLISIRYVAPANRAYVEQDSALTGVLADAITCNATVKSFGAEKREDKRLWDQVVMWRNQAMKTWLRHDDLAAVQYVFLIGMQGALLSLVLWYWTRGLATPGQVTLVIATFLMMHGYLRDVGMHMRNLQQAVNDIEDLVNFHDTEPEIRDVANAEDYRSGPGQIAFNTIRFGYANQSKPLYDDFSITIEAGEKVALVGASGSGKSTFVKLVQRLYDVERGQVLIDGQNIAALTQESLRRAIALVPQEPILFHRSLGENIGYARPGASLEQIQWAAKKAHADDFISQLNEGYQTLVGERGVKLSGGERQRVAIARAFLADAPVLILDEATSSLDSVTETKIQSAIQDLMEGRTTILIAHRLSTIKMVDRILVFSDGRIIEQGTHQELILRPDGQYRRLYETQYGNETRAA